MFVLGAPGRSRSRGSPILSGSVRCHPPLSRLATSRSVSMRSGPSERRARESCPASSTSGALERSTPRAYGAVPPLDCAIYSTTAGTQPVIVVPRPTAEPTARSPPRAATRSPMPASPEPLGVDRGSNPTPSSETANMRRSASRQSRTCALEARAYLETFWSASRQEKYTAASTPCSYRPTSFWSTSTGSGAFAACADKATTSPC